MKKYILIAVSGLVALGTIQSKSVNYTLIGLEKSKKFYEGKVKKLQEYLSNPKLMSQQRLMYETAIEKQQERADYYQNLINEYKETPQQYLAKSKLRLKKGKKQSRLGNLYNQLTNKKNLFKALQSSTPNDTRIPNLQKEIIKIENEIIRLESQ